MIVTKQFVLDAFIRGIATSRYSGKTSPQATLGGGFRVTGEGADGMAS